MEAELNVPADEAETTETDDADDALTAQGASEAIPSDGTYYLSVYADDSMVLGAANGRLVTASKKALGVSNQWSFVRASAQGAFTILTSGYFLACKDAHVRLSKTADENALWKIASTDFGRPNTVALYSASTGAVLGLSADVWRKPLISECAAAYPAIPASSNLLWIMEEVRPEAWTIVLDPNGGTGTMGQGNVITVAGGQSSPALVNGFVRPGYAFAVGWMKTASPMRTASSLNESSTWTVMRLRSRRNGPSRA